MSLSRPKGSKVWVMDFMFHGQRIRETTGMSSITRAREVEGKRKQALRDGAAGIRRTPTTALALRCRGRVAEDQETGMVPEDVRDCQKQHGSHSARARQETAG